MKSESAGADSKEGVGAPELERKVDAEWRARAAKVLPRGAYGHIRPEMYPPNYPQFYDRSEGCRIWDVDGNGYIDLMCSWGPMILGYGNAEVDRPSRPRSLSVISPSAIRRVRSNWPSG